MGKKRRTIIACSMMEDELKSVYRKTGCSDPIIWMDRGYHNTPELLRKKLQKEILDLQDQEEILLTFGLCGNGTAGIYSPCARLILPKFDDCLNMFLCTGKRKQRALVQAGTIYLTRGWTLDRESIIQQYHDLQEKYDEETCEIIMETMYAHYDSITLIDTGCYNMEETRSYAEKAGSFLNLKIREKAGSVKILEQLLSGCWDENFIVMEPGKSISEEMFGIAD